MTLKKKRSLERILLKIDVWLYVMYTPEGKKVHQAFVKGSSAIIFFEIDIWLYGMFNNFGQFENLDGTIIHRHGKVWLHVISQQNSDFLHYLYQYFQWVWLYVMYTTFDNTLFLSNKLSIIIIHYLFIWHRKNVSSY